MPLLTGALRSLLPMKVEMTNHTVQFDGRLIPYSLTRKDRRNLRVIVNPDLSVIVYAPCRAKLREIEAAVSKKARWIARTLDKVATYHPLPAPKQYISGETFVYLGRQYRLKVVNGAQGSAKLIGRHLRVYVADCQSREKVRRLVEQWYREHASVTFDRYLAQCYAVASRHGATEPTLCVRKMKRRWGSCSESGRITLNVSLVQAPVHCIEYVIMHELCHLCHHNHSPAFYGLLTRCLPDWRSRKDALDSFRLG